MSSFSLSNHACMIKTWNFYILNLYGQGNGLEPDCSELLDTIWFKLDSVDPNPIGIQVYDLHGWTKPHIDLPCQGP